jgi:hypothetical protein
LVVFGFGFGFGFFFFSLGRPEPVAVALEEGDHARRQRQKLIRVPRREICKFVARKVRQAVAEIRNALRSV